MMLAKKQDSERLLVCIGALIVLLCAILIRGERRRQFVGDEQPAGETPREHTPHVCGYDLQGRISMLHNHRTFRCGEVSVEIWTDGACLVQGAEYFDISLRVSSEKPPPRLPINCSVECTLSSVSHPDRFIRSRHRVELSRLPGEKASFGSLISNAFPDPDHPHSARSLEKGDYSLDVRVEWEGGMEPVVSLGSRMRITGGWTCGCVITNP
jgi:hypothetical protein